MAPLTLAKLFPAVLAFCWSAAPARAVVSDPVSFANTPFDYIIVGGGTTGLSIAARLSEKPDVLVGVIEAGEHREDNNILMPGFAGSTLGNPEYDWLLSTVPQPQLHNRSVGLGRGKLLGGTSALNFLAYERASMIEYDGWQVLGNEGFTFEEVLPFMQATENWTSPDQFYVDNFLANNDTFNHGSGGPVQTTAYANYSDLEQPFFATMGSLGVQPNIAPSGGDTVGMWSISVGLDPVNKTRSYAANAFYEPNADRQNLVLLTGAQGIRVHFADTKQSGDLFHANGVEFIGNDNATRVASASREIILSAGSLKTPQVLELSGIGNATLLRELGLPSIIDLPGVGENLQDHPGVIAEFQTLSNQTTYDELNDPVIAPQQFAQYVENRTGLYSAFASTCVFLPWGAVLDNDTIQTFKADLDKALASDKRFNHPTFELQRQWLDNEKVPQLEVIFFPQNSNVGVGNGTKGERFYTISTLVQHPWNRGSVHVTSPNGLEPPTIDMAYLESPADIDLRVLVEALRFAHKISQTEPIKSLTPAVLAPTLDATDDELISWARNTTSTNFHIVGSTAMLPRENFGVVDNTFKVYGTDNLRIVDAGVYPLQMASHPVATLYGLGERAAHIISSAYV